MKVSVTIPCYNSASYIGETIESVLAQTRPADEIIVADDCSTDASRDVVRRYPQVTLVTQAKNSGCASSRNLAIHASTGDVIAIVDSDDVWYPDHLETMAGLLARHPDVGFAFSEIRRFGLHEGDNTTPLPPGEPLQLFDDLLYGNFIPQPTVVFRRALYDECGGFDSSMRYCEDYDLWLRFAERSSGAYTGRITAGYRIHPEQLNQHHLQMFTATWHARFKLLDRVQSERPDDLGALQQRLGDVWRNGLYTAWAFRSRESLEYMLSLRDRFPDQQLPADEWQRRLRVWPLLATADRAGQILPEFVRRTVRPAWGDPTDRLPRI